MSDWSKLKTFTKARVGLGHSGASLATSHHLEILKAQAQARDALWRQWELEDLRRYLAANGQTSLTLSTLVSDRRTYLARPDWGRRLSEESQTRLASHDPFAGQAVDTRVVFCVSDGLSAEAIIQHLVPFLDVFLPRLPQENFFRSQSFPFVLLPFSRVACADHVGELMQSELSVIFVGERPGLSAHDSMGIYLTYHPRCGTLDGQRNCISNVRPPDGLSYELATAQLLYLMRESLSRRLSGVDLKMESDALLGVSDEKTAVKMPVKRSLQLKGDP
jgi:ethanolamine ammonia-lyase small subunit